MVMTVRKIMTELTYYCDVILGNEEDAEKHFGIHPEGTWMFIKMVLMSRPKLSYLSVSR